jgi:uncharacterized protein (DUF4415 family)
MPKQYSGSPAPAERAKKSVKSTPDSEIDFSDIPELTKDQLKSLKRVGRPLLGISPRKMIAIRIDLDVLSKIKNQARRMGKPYQSLINEILSKHVSKKAA